MRGAWGARDPESHTQAHTPPATPWASGLSSLLGGERCLTLCSGVWDGQTEGGWMWEARQKAQGTGDLPACEVEAAALLTPVQRGPEAGAP